MDGRTDGHLRFTLLGRLRRVDLINDINVRVHACDIINIGYHRRREANVKLTTF